MNKFLGIMLVVLFAISLTGCKGKVTDLDGNEKNNFDINETAAYNNINYTITKAEYSNGVEYGFGSNEDETNIYYILAFQVENNSKKAYKDSYGCILKTKETTSEQITTIIVHDESTPDPLSAGEKETKILAWEISKEDRAQTYNCYTSEAEFTFDLEK